MGATQETLRWKVLQTRAHLPEVQEEIRHEIRAGMIRVAPARDGSIRIIPAPRSAQADKTASMFLSSTGLGPA